MGFVEIWLSDNRLRKRAALVRTAVENKHGAGVWQSIRIDVFIRNWSMGETDDDIMVAVSIYISRGYSAIVAKNTDGEVGLRFLDPPYAVIRLREIDYLSV